MEKKENTMAASTPLSPLSLSSAAVRLQASVK